MTKDKQLLGTEATPAVLKDLETKKEVKEIFTDGSSKNLGIYFPVKSGGRKIKIDNGPVTYLSPNKIREIEMQNLPKGLKLQIEKKRQKTKDEVNATPKITHVKIALALLLSTGEWVTTKDLVELIGITTGKYPTHGSAVSILSGIYNSDDGKKFLRKKTKKRFLYLRLKYHEVSLIDLKLMYMLYRGKITWEEVVKLIPELAKLHPITDDEEAIKKDIPENAGLDEEKNVNNRPELTLEEGTGNKSKEAIDRFYNALKKATKASLEIPGAELSIKFKFSSKEK